MILRDISFLRPAENIVFDEVLLQRAETAGTGEALRFWESKDVFAVLGRISKEQDDLNMDEITNVGIPVLRRASGGGTVLQGRGCLNYSLILSKEKRPELFDLTRSYQYILGKIVQAFAVMGTQTVYWPISDIALKENAKKFSGNAQKRLKKYILHHGTILYNFDIALLEKFLTMPKDMPEYRNNRPHKNFVANVGLSGAAIKEALQAQFAVQAEAQGVSEEEKRLLREFVTRKDPVINIQPVI